MRKREERIDREFQEKERERIKMAREKARYEKLFINCGQIYKNGPLVKNSIV